MIKDLTEQWKNGELEGGIYYINHELMGIIQAEYEANYNNWYNFGCDVELSNENIKEVLAEVPDYIEWRNYVNGYCEEHEAYNRIIEENAKLKEYIEELEEMLKKCQVHVFDLYGYRTGLINQIDEVLDVAKD